MAAAEHSNSRNSSSELLQELEALSESLNKSDLASINRTTASFALPPSSGPEITSSQEDNASKNDPKSRPTGRSRRLSLSSLLFMPKFEDKNHQTEDGQVSFRPEIRESNESEKKPNWKSWKPIRALSRIGKQKLTCLFSVQVITIRNLPTSMNGLRLSVCVRKKETKDRSVHTMPSRVSEKSADYEETLFLKCHVYFTQVQGKQIKFEPRPFLIYVSAVDAEELSFGRTYVDLSRLVQESIDKSSEGVRVRHWETIFDLSGKAKGGELLVKLGFQIMEKDGGFDIYNQSELPKSIKDRRFSLSFARRQSKNSFSVPGTHSQRLAFADLCEVDQVVLNENSRGPASNFEDFEFEVVEKGVEVEIENRGDAEEGRSESSEVVKEMVNDRIHRTMLIELDSIAQQIKALEFVMFDGKNVEEETESQRLDAEEENVTREFLQLLEHEESNGLKLKSNQSEISQDSVASESHVFIPDLGKNLGCVVQTRDGGYLAAMNPFDTLLARQETPKLAMQMSKQFIIPLHESVFKLFQKMAGEGFEELSTRIFALMPLDELMGKSAEQIAFEGIATAIIQGRNREVASSSAARAITAAKTMVRGMSSGRKDRISTGIWIVNEIPLALEEILAFSLQKIETMAVEALKIQAEISEEYPPFDVSPLSTNTSPLESAVSLENWVKDQLNPENISLVLVVQLRDPTRQYEAVGGPALVVIQATRVESEPDGEIRFKVTNLHVGGLKMRSGEKRNVWDNEKQKLTATQWLLGNGLGKAAKRGKRVFVKGPDLLWSVSSRVMADMWLKPVRNPDIRLTK